ncbi:MAG: ribosome silencing factor [Parahaliea sp.]
METEQLKQVVENALGDMKAVNTVALEVTELTDVMDYLVITSGTSTRHVKSLADNVCLEAKKQGVRPLGVEGEDAGEWVLVDFGDVVVHVMLPATRDFYDLERLWMKPETRQEEERERD